MAEFVTKNQQLQKRAVSPITTYSRVIGVNLVVPDDGTAVFVVTPIVGNMIWLLNIKVMCVPKVVNAAQATAFTLWAGQGRVTNAAAILQWQRICPMIDNTSTERPWVLTDGRDIIEWNMRRRYEGKNRRFGVRAYRAGGVQVDGLWVSFTISEG